MQPLALDLLLGPRRGDLRLTFGPLPFKLVIAAGIQGQLSACEVEDMVGHVVKEIALVADQQDRRRVRAQEILEPQHRFEIEVVRGLVEQQQVGLREQQRCQRHAHPPAAGEAFQRALLRGIVEAKSGQDPRRARRSGMGLDRDQPLVDLSQAVGIMAGLAFRNQRGAFVVSGEDCLERGGITPRGILGDIADAAATRHRHLATVSLQHPGNHPHQRRLAGAVAPDQPDPPARRQVGRSAIDDRASAKANRYPGQVKHAARLAGPGAKQKWVWPTRRLLRCR